MKLASVEFKSYNISVSEALDEIGARDVLSKQSAILVKPNLINASPPPVTTPFECCGAIVGYIRSFSDAEIVIAEGCGDTNLETGDVFKKLGYEKIAKQYGIDLVDLNALPSKKYQNPECSVFPEMYLPEIMFSHFIISVPVLKAHSLASVTGALKNMMGFVPPEYYSGRGGVWRKAAFHEKMHRSVADLARHRAPDLSVMDATVGLADYHLGGRRCDPPPNRILAGHDPWDVDRLAAKMLGLDWREIPHLHA